MHSCSSLENHTRFHTKMGKVYTRFQTKKGSKTLVYPLGGTYLYGIYKGVLAGPEKFPVWVSPSPHKPL